MHRRGHLHAAVGPVSEPAVPLARLLLLAHRQLVDGLHERLRERGWTDVRESYGFVLLVLVVFSTLLSWLMREQYDFWQPDRARLDWKGAEWIGCAG